MCESDTRVSSSGSFSPASLTEQREVFHRSPLVLRASEETREMPADPEVYARGVPGVEALDQLEAAFEKLKAQSRGRSK